MFQRTRLAALILAIAAASLSAPAKAQDPTVSKGDVKIPDRINADSLRLQMRKLWVSNAIWMREYIVNTIGADLSLDAATRRLARNQEEIGRAFATFYGPEVGNKVTTLLKQHSSLVSQMIAAVRAGNRDSLRATDQRWTTNAKELATVLSTANPDNWSLASTQPLLADALNSTATMTRARLEREWNIDVEEFDKVLERSLVIADAISGGIIKQFPNK
jgi:hypothetical protein